MKETSGWLIGTLILDGRIDLPNRYRYLTDSDELWTSDETDAILFRHERDAEKMIGVLRTVAGGSWGGPGKKEAVRASARWTPARGKALI